MPGKELVGRCCRNDENAWQQLCRIAHAAASGAVSSVLRAGRLDDSAGDDVMQALYLRLVESDYRRLTRVSRPDAR